MDTDCRGGETLGGGAMHIVSPSNSEDICVSKLIMAADTIMHALMMWWDMDSVSNQAEKKARDVFDDIGCE